jgi:hypothetical protein
MPKKNVSLPESITELRAQLEEFRATHPHRTRLPESVWQSATELARCHGLYVVARSLRLDYSTLKKRVNGSTPPSQLQQKKSSLQFVELVSTAGASVDEYVIEFASARGAQLRVHCKTGTPPDWAALLQAWRKIAR